MKGEAPHGKPENMAMIYAVGPRGALLEEKLKDYKEETVHYFLDYLEVTGANAIRNVNAYNKHH